MLKRKMTALLAVLVLSLSVGITASPAQALPGDVATVVWSGNGYTGGIQQPPTVSAVGTTITVGWWGPQNNPIVRTGYSVAKGGRYNTKADGTGISYRAGRDPFVVPEGGAILYFEWDANAATVTYDANAATSGSAPAAVTSSTDASLTLPSAGSLVKRGYTFHGWNTKADGTGTTYTAGASYVVPANGVTLYARWVVPFIGLDGLVLYRAKDLTSGGLGYGDMVALSSGYAGDTVTISGVGNMKKAGFTFAGWNTKDNGAGTSYAPGKKLVLPRAIVELWAQWTRN